MMIPSWNNIRMRRKNIKDVTRKVKMKNYDFSGWASQNGVRCSDGRTIMNDAFINDDGKSVPLVWNHQHNSPDNVLGHAVLENRPTGVYAYCTFNNTPKAQFAKEQVLHGDITALSIWANQLKQTGGNVHHGAIKEVSLVLAGANPGAYIDSIMAHGECSEDEAIIYNASTGLFLSHGETNEPENEKGDQSMDYEAVIDSMTDEQIDVVNMLLTQQEQELSHADVEENPNATVQDVWNTLTETQKKCVYAIIGAIAEQEGIDPDKGKDDQMKHNVFDNSNGENNAFLIHSELNEIVANARDTKAQSLKAMIADAYGDEFLAHGFEDISKLFPDYKDVRPGEPETWTRDQTWVNKVMTGVNKTPFQRIRTRVFDARGNDLRARGYEKGNKKTKSGDVKLLSRVTDPQTIYRTDSLERDDILDVQDIDIVNYTYKTMERDLKEEIALAMMVGDGREISDKAKIKEDHIRPIWTDDELFTIHHDIDIEATKNELQGGDTKKYFGDSYVYAEALINAALYSREEYRGSGSPTFFCTTRLLNTMLLARDRNGRRIYDGVNDLATAMNVKEIVTVEQFSDLVRKDDNNKCHKLLGIIVNLSDYNVGAVKDGGITKFDDFDIDFNQYKYLIETRMSGALVGIKSAIVLEEPVANPANTDVE